MAKKEKTYQQAIEELQLILDRIDSGDLDVDQLTEDIKKASSLLKFCKQKLYNTDTEIKRIFENLD